VNIEGVLLLAIVEQRENALVNGLLLPACRRNGFVMEL
jgi:hypothetical protein